jgi:hypothetical protein
MAKSPEQQYEIVRQDPRGCTLQKMERLLEAWGFERGKRSRRNENLRAWSCGEITLTLHKPHGRTMKIGAVKQALTEIDKVRALYRKADGSGDDTAN